MKVANCEGFLTYATLNWFPHTSMKASLYDAIFTYIYNSFEMRVWVIFPKLLLFLAYSPTQDVTLKSSSSSMYPSEQRMHVVVALVVTVPSSAVTGESCSHSAQNWEHAAINQTRRISLDTREVFRCMMQVSKQGALGQITKERSTCFKKTTRTG